MLLLGLLLGLVLLLRLLLLRNSLLLLLLLRGIQLHLRRQVLLLLGIGVGHYGS